MLLIKNPELAMEFMELCTGPWLDMVVAEVESGADVVWVNDPVSSADCISRAHYEKITQPYEKRFVEAIRERTGVPVIFHPCGNWHDRLDLVAQTGADALFPGTMDFKQVYDKTMGVANVRALNGGVGSARPSTIDVKGITPAEDATTLLDGKPDDVEREARRAIRIGTQKGAGLILGGNCFPPLDVPAINLDAMVYSARKYGRYPISI
jgi:uroporphyrinogen decarboxylase